MTSNLSEEMKARARFVAGSDAWERTDTDPLVRISLQDAEFFLKAVQDKVGDPHITGGTTDKPENILTLYWTIIKSAKIAGVYVTFNGDRTCNILWNTADGSTHRMGKMSVTKLPAIDVVRKLEDLDYSPPFRRFNWGL